MHLTGGGREGSTALPRLLGAAKDAMVDGARLMDKSE